jgi:hypothetical protein
MPYILSTRPTHWQCVGHRFAADFASGGERTSDVIRRALRLLEREIWLTQARADADRLVGEDLSEEQDAW